MADDKNDTSRFVWQPGDIVILSPAPAPHATVEDLVAKAIVDQLSKIALHDTDETRRVN